MQDYYKEAKAAFKAKKYEIAIEYCDKILTQTDEELGDAAVEAKGKANFVKGNSLFALDRFRDAITTWELISFEGATFSEDAERAFAQMLFKKSYALNQLGQLEESQKCLREATILEPSLAIKFKKPVAVKTSSVPVIPQKRERNAGDAAPAPRNLGMFNAADTESETGAERRAKVLKSAMKTQATRSPSPDRKA